MRVYINVENKNWNKYKIDFEKIANAAVNPVYKDSEVSITLVDDKQIHKLNKQYRGFDKPTNVLSFELGDDVLLGDIFISLDTVSREAKEADISVPEHVAHMIVHGMLHLQGFDHINDDEAKVMENKEIEILKKLGYKNPYSDDEVVCENKSCCPGKIITKLENIKIKEGSFSWYILTCLFGIIASFGFAPFYLWWATLFGVGAMYWLSTRQHSRISFIKSWLRAFPFGAMYGISMFWWILNSMYVIPELTEEVAIWTIPSLFGIGLLCGTVLSIPYAVIRYIQRKPPYRIILFATTCTLILWCREWFLTGFPWNPISNITMNMPMVINSISLWGALGLSFIITGLIASVIELLRNRHDKSCWSVFILYIALFIGGCGYGYYNMKIAGYDNSDNHPLVRLVQPATSMSYKMPSSREDAYNTAKQKTRDLFVWATQDKSATPDIIVFPETSYPYTMVDDSFPFSHVLNTNVIMGTKYYENGNFYNSMVFADKDGKVKNVYHKYHLVPFGEYQPLGRLIPSMGKLTPGKTKKELIKIDTQYGDFVVAPAICYEIIFSDSLVKSESKLDAIINITNDTWFGTTPGIAQHLDMVRRYAIESGVPVIRANYSGISAFVLSNGNVESMIPVKQNGTLDGFVYGAHITPYRLFGRDLWMAFILMFSIFVSISISLFPKKD